MQIKRFQDTIDENIIAILREKGSVCPSHVHEIAGHTWKTAKDGLDRLVFKGLADREVRFRQYWYTLKIKKGESIS